MKATGKITEQVAAFISRHNRNEHSYVGYCGTNPQEIQESPENFEVPFEQAVFTVKRDGELLGVLALDIDVAACEVEVWGPFIASPEWQAVAKELWKRSMAVHQQPFQKMSFFPSLANRNAIEFAQSIGAVAAEENSIFQLKVSDASFLSGSPLTELTEADFSNFILLHDRLFPTGYLSGREIIDGRHEDWKVFVIGEPGTIAGYVFVEVDPEHGESQIHFFGVEEKYRGKGYGRQLLQTGARWIFSHPEISEINLCVESENEAAVALYKSIGFTERHRCLHLVFVPDRQT